MRFPTEGHRWKVVGPAGAGLILTLVCAASAHAQRPTAGSFGDLAAGPYDRLVIRDAMVVPGHGGPPSGPYDIVIEGDLIKELIPFDPVASARRGAVDRPTGDRVIEAAGMYVMPGMIDLHTHLRTLPIELEYVYYLKLAHGVTTMVHAPDRGLAEALAQARLSQHDQILAPRLFPIWRWGQHGSWDLGFGFSREEFEDPAQAERIAERLMAAGAHVVDVGRGNLFWDHELFQAVTRAVRDAGGITTFHLPPSSHAVINAVDAARLGVTMIEHHYGYAESSLDGRVHDFPRDYDYNDENHRFREAGRVWEQANRERLLSEVAEELAKSGVTMIPTRVVYEASRDILRAQGLPWHEKYTHQALIDWNIPNPAHHGSFHYDWTSDDEESWRYAFDLWGDLIHEFNKRGGQVGYATDDNYIWATPGFSNVRELQLLRETRMHALEVLRAATYNSARTLRQKRLGLVHPGYTADLILVDGNPRANLRYLYSFGAIRLSDEGELYRTRGIVHTIKGGIVMDNARLMEEVARIVARSKQGVGPNIVTAPFLVPRPAAAASGGNP